MMTVKLTTKPIKKYWDETEMSTVVIFELLKFSISIYTMGKDD